jgi:hypothetical protein
VVPLWHNWGAWEPFCMISPVNDARSTEETANYKAVENLFLMPL